MKLAIIIDVEVDNCCDELYPDTKLTIQRLAQLAATQTQGDSQTIFTEEGIRSYVELISLQDSIYQYIEFRATKLAKTLAKRRGGGYFDNTWPKVKIEGNTVSVITSHRYQGDSNPTEQVLEFPLRYLWMDFDEAIAEDQAEQDIKNSKLAAAAYAEAEKKLAAEKTKRRREFEKLKAEFEPK